MVRTILALTLWICLFYALYRLWAFTFKPGPHTEGSRFSEVSRKTLRVFAGVVAALVTLLLVRVIIAVSMADG